MVQQVLCRCLWFFESKIFVLVSRFAIVARVFDGEAPYLQPFIDHRRRLGVDSFYPAVAPGAPPLCREIFARNGIVFYEWDGQRISFV